ncbi:MAG: hypothetical protein IJH50_14390 [Kiritimatiellae bacterium]|nr:hypothetical protein [Kiritimatiellia bacterium]
MAVALALAGSVAASWYWPFGSSDGESSSPRLSELMEPASLLIDEASDLAADGKIQESVEKYRAALEELDRIEGENPDRAASQEFATVRNKRAYVNAAIDSLLLGQVRENAKSVAVSDTTELEKRLAEEKKKLAEEGKQSAEEGKPANEEAGKEDTAVDKKAQVAPAKEKTKDSSGEKAAKPKRPVPEKPLSRREQVMADIDAGEFAEAELLISEMLIETPNGAMALNLKASLEAAQGKTKDAERTLDQAIMSNPRSHYAYYNMASLLLQADPTNKAAARRYYETGRAIGGPVDEQLEEALKR